MNSNDALSITGLNTKDSDSRQNSESKSPRNKTTQEMIFDNYIGNQQVDNLETIKNKLGEFEKNFHKIFCREVLSEYLQNIEDLVEEKFQKYSEIEKEYNDQLNALSIETDEAKQVV